MNQNLTWNDHFHAVFILIPIPILKRLKHYLPLYARKNLYKPNKVILKHLNYVNIAWGKHNNRLYNLKKITHNYCL